MKKLSKFPFFISLMILSLTNSWSLESLWEKTLKNKGEKKYFFLSDPDNILTEKEIRDLEGHMTLLFNQWNVNTYLFIINKLDSPSIDDEYLDSITNSLFSKIEKEINNKSESTFVSIIIANNKVTKYKLGKKLMQRATKRELERMKENSQKKLKEEERLYTIFLSQFSSIEYIIDGEDDVIPGWDDWPYPNDDPDDLDDPNNYPDNDNVNVNNKTKREFVLPNSIYIIIIIFLVVLVLFLIWLFFSLARRVKQMSSGKIDYNMFPNEIDLNKK